MALIHRIVKKPFFGRYQRPWRWPDGIPQDGWERVTFLTSTGTKLVGVFGSAEVLPATAALVLAHPLSISAKGFWLKQGHAALLRKSGFDVLAFDFNGFGDSESSDFDYPSDVIAAGEYLRKRLPTLPIAVLGSSFGAGWAVCAMAKEKHPFRAAVLEAVFPSLPSYWRRYPVPFAVLRATQILYPKIEEALRPVRAASALKSNPRVLLIYGEADSMTPVHIGIDLWAKMSDCATVELWTVPGAEHVLALQAQPQVYSERVVGFLRRSINQL